MNRIDVRDRRVAERFSDISRLAGGWVALGAVLFVCADAAGAVTKVWEQSYDGGGTNTSSFDKGSLAAFDSNGDVIVEGDSGTNSYTVKYGKTDGRLIWEEFEPRSLGPGPFERRWVRALIADSNGDAVTTGREEYRTNDATHLEMLTRKRSGASGDLLWEKRVDGGRGWAAAIDTNGNVIATGSYGEGPVGDIYIAKYRGSDGGLLWERRHTNTNSRGFRPSGIVLDPGQNAIITGYADYRSYPDRRIFVAKFDANNGGVLWEWEGGEMHRAVAAWSALAAVDRNGDVFVTGGSGNTYTAKLRGLDGRVLWEETFFAPVPGSVNSWQIVVDSLGNLIAAGSYAEGAIGEAHFVKYGANDGTVIWERRFRVPDYRSAAMSLFVDEADDIIAGVTSDLGSIVPAPGPWRFSLLKLGAGDGAIVSEIAEQDFELAHMAKAEGGSVAVTGQRLGDMTTMLFRNEPRERLSLVEENGMLMLKWPVAHKGLRLEIQTGAGGILASGWTPVAGSTDTNAVTVPIEAGGKSAFFRLLQPTN